MKTDHSSPEKDLRRMAMFISSLGIDYDMMQVVIDNPEIRATIKERTIKAIDTNEYRFLVHVFDQQKPSMARVHRWIRQIGIEAFLKPLEANERVALCHLYGVGGFEAVSLARAAYSLNVSTSFVEGWAARGISKLRHPERDLIHELEKGSASQ